MVKCQKAKDGFLECFVDGIQLGFSVVREKLVITQVKIRKASMSLSGTLRNIAGFPNDIEEMLVQVEDDITYEDDDEESDEDSDTQY
eukprot:gene1969-2241_t